VTVTQGWPKWVRRLSFAAVLLVAAITPGMAAGGSSQQCLRSRCVSAGTIRWIRPMPGAWTVQNGEVGTTPVGGQAYAALGSQIAAIGSGLTVSAYQASTGQRLWTTVLTGFPAGSSITAVRVWPGVVTVGVVPPAPPGPSTGTAPAPGGAAAPGGHATGTGGAQAAAGTAATSGGTVAGNRPPRDEVVLRASTGHRIRAYPAAQFGGAVAASAATTVVVGPRAVTSYANHTGAARWSRPTGTIPQAWQVDGGELYMAVASGGYLGSAPVTALRRINLSTGAQHVVHSHGPSFLGALSLAYQGVVVFSSPRWTRGYSTTTGRELWHYPSALPDTVDAVAGRLYLLSGNTLIGVNPRTGSTVARVSAASSSGLYGIREGAVLGIDHGALGKAWGFGIAAQQVLWTSRPLPWPHYFVDLSGIGGSAPPDQGAVLLAICGQVAAQAAGTTMPRCTRPELAVLNR
jgi:putative pyrroloquinoline-quinone binding quinoprotein